MQSITIEPEKLYTKSAYAKAYSVSRPTLNKWIQTKEVKSIRIKGATLVIAA